MAQTHNTNLKKIAYTYLSLLNVKISKATLNASLEEHPFYPTLFSLSDTFSHFKVPNYAVNLTDKELEHMELPFLAYISTSENGSDFVIVKSYSTEKVELIVTDSKPIEMPMNEFAARYRGLVFVAEPGDSSGDHDFSKNLLKQRWQLLKRIMTVTGIVAALCYLFFTVRSDSPSYLTSVFFCSKLLGVTASCLLIYFELSTDNSFMKKVCSVGKKTNCEAVLLSKHSKIFGVSLSSIGWCYYFGSLLLLLIPTISSVIAVNIIVLGAIMCLPFIFYSLYLQAVVIKHWCPLCLIVITFLAFEGSLSIWYLLNNSIDLSVNAGLAAVIVCFIVAIISTALLRSILLTRFEAAKLNISYKRLQFNPDVFKGMLGSQPAAAHGWEQLGLFFGSENARTQIIKVCNPFCKPCSDSHSIFHQILNENSNVSFRIIFNVQGNLDHEKTYVVKLFLALQKSLKPKDFLKVLDDWYSMPEKNYKLFQANQPKVDSVDQYTEELNAMFAWCKESEITYTPTIFINNRRLPEYIGIDNLPKMGL